MKNSFHSTKKDKDFFCFDLIIDCWNESLNLSDSRK